MPINQFGPASFTGASDRSGFDAGLRAHMLRVYNYMAGGVGLTGIVAWLVMNTPLGQAFLTPGVLLFFMFSPLLFILAINFGVNRMQASTLQLLFWSYCACMGVSMSLIFYRYTEASIAQAFFITAATFAAMSLWGYSTRRDLSGFGALMMMGVFGILIASFVNIGLAMFGHPSFMLYWVTSVIGVLVFTGLTAWDTQYIKQSYAESYGVEANAKLAVMGALRLYLNFINAFLFMLRLMGTRR